MLDLRADPIALTAALVDIPSESRHEQRIADEIEAALREQASGYEVVRNGDAVLDSNNVAVKAGGKAGASPHKALFVGEIAEAYRESESLKQTRSGRRGRSAPARASTSRATRSSRPRSIKARSRT